MTTSALDHFLTIENVRFVAPSYAFIFASLQWERAGVH